MSKPNKEKMYLPPDSDSSFLPPIIDTSSAACEYLPAFSGTLEHSARSKNFALTYKKFVRSWREGLLK